ncbi:hypothetical protein KKG22_00715 [Patescibacteria group bacterium]|nr:hypothetical protein [Patescibacteria group bacterium]MBU1721916.1 hypothetical protein [Patescibacteria group bacterium]MBU1901209.1 hypothetical protein [Patescibacteria group bacterium]
MDKKRIAFLIIFILVSIGIGYALYRVFFAGSITPPTTTTPPITQDGDPILFPIAGEGTDIGIVVDGGTGQLPTSIDVSPENTRTTDTIPQISQSLDNTVANMRIGANNNLQFYNRDDGKFYAKDINGTVKQLSDEVFFNVSDVTWSAKNNTAVLEYPDGANIIYNFDTKKQVTLPKHWEDFSFSSQGDHIAAKSVGLARENKWLVYTNTDGSETYQIEALGDNADKVIVDWSPNEQIVALARTGAAMGVDREEILFVGLHGENYRSMVVEGRGIEAAWSPTGDKLLYSVYSARSDYKPELWIVDATPQTIGQNRKLLNVETWPDKCTFSSERYVYCAVPVTLQTGAGLAPSLAETTPNYLVKIDTNSGSKSVIPLEENYVIDELFVDEQAGILYFTDSYSSGLFEVAL